MAHVTKTDRLLEAAMHQYADDPERATALDCTRRFKRSWIDLAEALLRVRENETYMAWGFANFHEYCQRELHLKRGTVDKLCASFGFLRAHAPRLVRAEPDQMPESIPTWQAVDFVARAEERGAADEETIDEMKRAVFDEALPAPALSRRYKEVAFPISISEKRVRLQKQILTTARRLAAMIADPEADIPDPLAERVEILVGELITDLDLRDHAGMN